MRSVTASCSDPHCQALCPDRAAANLPAGSLDVMLAVSLYEHLGAADRGLLLNDPVIKLHHDDPKLPFLLNARSWNRALASSDLDRALADSNAAIEKAGPLPRFLGTRALVQFRRKNFAASIAGETSALEKMPRLASALFIRGLARQASGDGQGGRADIAAARLLKANVDQTFPAYGLKAEGALTVPRNRRLSSVWSRHENSARRMTMTASSAPGQDGNGLE